MKPITQPRAVRHTAQDGMTYPGTGHRIFVLDPLNLLGKAFHQMNEMKVQWRTSANKDATTN